MSERTTAASPFVPFNFNPDPRFQRKLDLSEEGNVITVAVMLLLGHWPSVSRIENVLRNIFKDASRKRDRSSDFACNTCGQRFESKTKSSDKFALWTSPDLLQKYASENAIIVITTPSRILLVKAAELYRRRHLARFGRNSDYEPYLDFSAVPGIPKILEISRRPLCTRRP